MADERNAQNDRNEQDGAAGDDDSERQTTEEERLIPDDEISEDGQVYVDREQIDFDPEEGLYSGTAVHGGTDIPGPHEQVDDIDPNEADGDAENDGDAADDSNDGEDADDAEGAHE